MFIVKAIRAFIRREVLAWFRKEFTEAKIRKLVEGLLKQKLGTKKMVTKLAPELRAYVLGLGTVSEMGTVELTAADAQIIVKNLLDDVVEQVM